MLALKIVLVGGLVHFQSPSGNINCYRRARVPGLARVRRLPRPQGDLAEQAEEARELRPRLRPADDQPVEPQGDARVVPRRHRPAVRLHLGQVHHARVRPLRGRRADPLHLQTTGVTCRYTTAPRAGFLDRPRALRALPAMNLGIISTADINRKVIPGAHASKKVELVAVASREAEAAEAYAARVEDRARLRQLRGAARGSGDRRHLHFATEHDARRVVDPVGRGRQARPLREAVHTRTRATSRPPSTPPTARSGS